MVLLRGRLLLPRVRVVETRRIIRRFPRTRCGIGSFSPCITARKSLAGFTPVSINQPASGAKFPAPAFARPTLESFHSEIKSGTSCEREHRAKIKSLYERRSAIKIRLRARLAVIGTVVLLPGASLAGGKFDGNWTTHLSCEAHDDNPAHNLVFPSVVKDGVVHGQHGEEGRAGYLVIDGKISDDGSAKFAAKGTVSQGHSVFVNAMRGGMYTYNIKAQFTETKGTGTRDEGAGILGRACAFEFDKRPDDAASAAPAPPAPAPNTPQ
jgi:hypothetical protein